MFQTEEPVNEFRQKRNIDWWGKMAVKSVRNYWAGGKNDKDVSLTSDASITLKVWPRENILKENCCKVVRRREWGGRVLGLSIRGAEILRENPLALPFHKLIEDVSMWWYCWKVLVAAACRVWKSSVWRSQHRVGLDTKNIQLGKE